jgi:hypothetical protein
MQTVLARSLGLRGNIIMVRVWGLGPNMLLNQHHCLDSYRCDLWRIASYSSAETTWHGIRGQQGCLPVRYIVGGISRASSRQGDMV